MPKDNRPLRRLLIANRGEIAIRIARSAADLGIETVAVYAEDDALSLHTRHADRALDLGATGVAAYLDGPKLAALARKAGCDAIHPGYGFLSESAEFAESCEAEGIVFIGPTPETLRQFGDKAQARALAESCGVPVLPGHSRAVTLDEASAFLESMGADGAAMLKALGGGGGRGMRPVASVSELEEAFARATSEARQAFGSGDLYIEELLPAARHVEVQVVGDGTGAVCHLWDRECSLQRQRQKLVEIAPAFALSNEMRSAMLAAAVRVAAAASYRGVGTIEFLVDTRTEGRFVFMEANARLQVEHTVTEEVTGLDLVAVQLRIAHGATLRELGLEQNSVPAPRGTAVQVRVNLESMTEDGQSRPGGGVLTAYEPPSGPGVRVDGYGYAGYATSPHYDSLLAKVVAHADDLPAALGRARRALSEFKIEGVRSNLSFLEALLHAAPFAEGGIHTRYVEEHAAALLATDGARARYFEPESTVRKAGTDVDPDDPLAVLALKGPASAPQSVPTAPAHAVGPAGTTAVAAPLQGMLIELKVGVGDTVQKRQPVAVLEALKMEHVVLADSPGIVREIALEVGDTIYEETPILFVEPADIDGEFDSGETIDLDAIRPDVAEVQHFHRLTTDDARAEATAKRHDKGKRTARENIDDLCDAGSFFEYSPLVTATRYRTDTLEELEERVIKTAADAMVMGVGRVNGDLVGEENARCVAMSYDYTVLAGTQGGKNHQKQDRMFGIARKYKLPVVLYTEGGGGRTHGGRAAPADRRPAPWAGCTSALGGSSASSPAWCRSSASTRATASRATSYCSAPATSSSPRRIPASASAGPP